MQVKPIAYIRSPYTSKFAVPRQPGLVKAATARISFSAEFDDINLLRGIEGYSHLWLIFHFHNTSHQGWRAMVRPPRLGGNKKIGVLATRSTFRPNSLGLSVVRYIDHGITKGNVWLDVAEIDLIDGTPILDIKPYLLYADCKTDATAELANQAPKIIPVSFTPFALEQIKSASNQYPQLQVLIEQCIQQDPRPAYRVNKPDVNRYGMSLYEFDICWKITEQGCEVFAVNPT